VISAAVLREARLMLIDEVFDAIEKAPKKLDGLRARFGDELSDAIIAYHLKLLERE
jgi:hypothetical protein